MIEICTLIDITQTKIYRNIRPQGSTLSQEVWEFKRNQERNWNTIIQLLGLRFQPEEIIAPELFEHQRPAAYGFGWLYGPLNDITVWKCKCRFERPIDLWLFRADFDYIPIVTGLNESIIFPKSCLVSMGEHLNIVFKEVD